MTDKKGLFEKLNRLTKQEIIRLFMAKGCFLSVTESDFILVKIKTLSVEAETNDMRALKEMKKYSEEGNRTMWLEANKNHAKFMKAHKKIDLLYEKLKEVKVEK